VSALPAIIAGARRAGYRFVGLRPGAEDSRGSFAARPASTALAMRASAPLPAR
jgi:hypothetical protein